MSSETVKQLNFHPMRAASRYLTVVVRQNLSVSPLATKENWWEYLQRSRRNFEDSGAKFMTHDELEAHIQ